MSQHIGSTVRVAHTADLAPRELRAANTLDMSAGARLGIVRSYGYGESRPELRPVVEDQ